MQLKIRILAYLFVIVASARFVDHSFINDTEKEQNESAILYYYVFLDQQNKRKIRQIETQIH